jgi:hypothetical protein
VQLALARRGLHSVVARPDAGPQRKRAPATAGRGARQGAHRPSDGLSMVAGAPGGRRVR